MDEFDFTNLGGLDDGGKFLEHMRQQEEWLRNIEVDDTPQRIEVRLEQLENRLEEYSNRQERQYRENQAKAELDALKQRRNAWLVAIVSGTVGAIIGGVISGIVLHLLHL